MKSFLLDTCALLWWMADAPELGRAARRTIANQQNRILVSVATLWEIAIKRRKGRLDGVDEYLDRYADFHSRWGFLLVVIEAEDAVNAGRLEIPHEDPFDRMLIAQGQRLEVPIVTCDESIRRFTANCVW